MLKKLKSSNQGFTIIEVLIVLAIAALILLIVFLAVPALQRSSRNTSRKEDAGRTAAAVNSFVSNNNGTLPAVAGDGTAIIKDAGTLGQYPGFAEAAPLATPAANKLSIVVGGGGAIAALTVDGMQIVTAAKCDTSGGANLGKTTNVGASARSEALQYVSEQAGGTFQGLCQDI